MKKDLTELVFILDRSGSMAHLSQDTIGGFNSLIEKEKQEEGECLVSLVIFDDKTEVIYDRVNISDIPPLTEKEYYARGATALLDAIGGAIHHIGNVHKYSRKEDIPQKTMVIITTDGMENCSRIYSKEKVKAMITKEKTVYGWEFLFLGANIDAIETAHRYGIDSSRAVRYNADRRGVNLNYSSLRRAVSDYRRSGKLDENWAEEIRVDYKVRKEEK